ncbi:MAG TPA: adenosylcobinamide-GDP ribazoletransferase [Bradyrhizobium sp.]|nr:adenosylcobinamide-GDP ribazoletransferase [Bradyrhizobium sp.]
MNPIISPWLDDLLNAMAFLTRLPAPGRAGTTAPGLARAYRAFPLIGALIGAVIACADLLLLRAGLSPMPAAALALGTGMLLTGAIHEDGLADVADGFGGGRDKAKKLEIMRDSRLGTFGALTLLVTFAAKVGALSTLPQGDILLDMIVIHALSRAPLAVIAARTSYARDDGLAVAAGRPDARTAFASCFVAAVIALLCLSFGAAVKAMLVVAAAAFCLAVLAQRQIGGQTGDVLGAAEQVGEVVLLALLSAQA